MRADRLLSILMLLQTRGKMRAGELAAELEVSPRTIYRDIDALSIAGIPVYADGGPGGGYALLDSYRTDLTGLTREETEALFLLSIPGPVSDLAISKDLKGAVRKIASARTPDPLHGEIQISERLHLDSAPWFHRSDAPHFLDELQNAVWHDRKIEIGYTDKRGAESVREIAPYALVAKAATWYLVADTARGMRVFRLSRIVNLRELNVRFRRREGFILNDFWNEWCEGFRETLRGYPVVLSVSPEGRHIAAAVFDGIDEQMCTAKPDISGWVSIEVTLNDEFEAAYMILQLGTAVRVESPPALRERLRKEAAGILAMYEENRCK